MKYHIQKLDRRFSYNRWFEYYIGFANRMSYNLGPLNFDKVQQWFVKTYGWSVEMRQYEDMVNWAKTQSSFRLHKLALSQTPVGHELPDCCNPLWAWSNNHDDLRIYVASDKELAFFKLTFPVDQ